MNKHTQQEKGKKGTSGGNEEESKRGGVEESIDAGCGRLHGRSDAGIGHIIPQETARRGGKICKESIGL